MNYLTRDIPIYQHCRQVLSTLVVAGVLAGCATANEGTGGTSDDDAGGINTEDCSIARIDGPVASETDEPETSRPVCIVFNADECPVYTVFAGRLNGVPDLQDDDVARLSWQAVTADGAGKYSNLELPAGAYSIVFDPFLGPQIISKNKGWAQSQPLCGTNPTRTNCVPTGVEFKYTVWTPDKADCNPLDPVIRVNR